MSILRRIAHRRKFYVNPGIQFPIIATLILLVTIEGVVVGWGVYAAIGLARQWDQPDQAGAFLRLVAFLVVPVVVLNFLFGAYLSHKIAGPLERLYRGMAEVARGNLEGDIRIRTGDLLSAFAMQFNKMVETLRRLIYRDHRYVAEVNDLLTQCERRVDTIPALKPSEREEMHRLVKEAKSRLSIINDHFMKGKLEGA